MTGIELTAAIGGATALAGVASTVLLAWLYARERTKATDARMLMAGYRTGLENSQAEVKEKGDEIRRLVAALTVVRKERDDALAASVRAASDESLRKRLQAKVPRAAGAESTEPTGGVSTAASTAKTKRPRK